MKRRKDDEKSMGPMFPRLHVNDTEKGGLRAPPRNKMALYEQLSIPSQRFNPLKPNSNNHVPPPSSSQVSGSDRNAFIPLQLTPSAPTFQFEKLNAPESGRARAVTSLARSGSAEDNFAVPVFIQSTAVHGKSTNKKSGEKLTNTDSNCTVQSKRIQRANGNDPKDNSSNVDLRQDVRSQTAIEPKESASSSGVGENSPKNLPDVGGFGKSFAEIEKSKRAARLQSENVARDYGLQVTLTLKNIEVDPPSIPRDPSSGDIQCVDDGEFVSDERSNDGSASDASIVDPVSTMDISPDDVVGIIGQKHFWKARKAIVNQQRVFAVQVFELHRLIKVQKLIAGSPHLMLEDSSAASKPSSIATFPAEKVALDMVVNVDSPSPTIVKHQDHEPAKQSHPECSAEKAVGKPVVASSRNATPGTAAPDTWTGPWGGGGGGPGPGPNQWMVPMMSPTEGLVYKPCPGPVYRSCGSSALMGSFPNPAFAYPHHQPLFPGFPHAGHNNNYFPSYGMMPMMSVPVSRQGSEAMNLEHVSCVRTGDVDTNHRSSSFAADFQGSTPSSPIKNAKRSLENRAVVSAQQKNQSSCNSELNHPGEGSVGFRSVHVEADGDQQPRRRVIKAVPHNRRSASESVARIFRSIQEERKR